MAGERRRAAAAIATARDVAGGEGAMDVPPQCALITGWAWDPRRPDVAVEVEIHAGADRLATVPAYWYRPDLAAAGIGNGRHAWLYPTPPRLKDGQPRVIRARVSGADRELAGSPTPFVCAVR